MSRIHSRPASNIIRSAISAFLLASCATQVAPPVATIADPGAAHVGLPVQLDGSNSVSLRAGQELSYDWQFLALPPRSAAKLNDGKLARPSFTPDVAGTYALRMTVDDGILAASADLTVDVKDDCRPLISGVSQAPEAPNVGQTTGVNVTAASSCGTNATIVAWQWTLVSAPAGSKAQLLLATTQHASFTPDVRGDYDLLVVVTDSQGLSSDPADPKAHLRYSTRACGDNVPVIDSITPAPAAVDVGTRVQLTPAVHDDDTATACGLTRALSYSWQMVEVPAGSQARLNDVHVKQPSFTPDLHGTYRAALTVNDELGRVSQQAIASLTTTGCGDAIPGATAQGPAATVPSGTSVQLHTAVTNADNPDYNGVDPVGGPATTGAGCRLALTYSYRWQMVSAPLGSKAALNNVSLANPTFVADVPGTYKASVVAIASTGRASAPSLVTVTVAQCGSVPVTAAIVAPASAITSAAVQLSSTVTDTNSACFTTVPYAYSWTLLSAPAGSHASLSGTAAAGTSSAQQPSFTPDLAGDYVVGLTVTDQLGLRAQAAPATVTASNCNAALGAIISVNGNAGAGLTSITGSPTSLSAAVTDPNAGGSCTAPVVPYAYAWSIVNQPAGSIAQLNDASGAAPSFTADVAGTWTVQLQVTDAAGNQSPAVTQDIGVTSCTSPLVVNSIAVAVAGALPTGAPVPLTATVTDPNLKAVTAACPLVNANLVYDWQLAAQPSGSHATLNNAGASNPSFVPDVAGTYTVQLSVTDAAGNASAAKQQNVVVATCNQPLGVVISANGSAAAASNVVAGSAVSLSAAVADANDPATNTSCSAAVKPYSYSWRLLAQPTGSAAALNAPASATPSFTPDVAGGGQYQVVLDVTDAAGNRGTSQTVTLTAPTASSCNQALGVAGTLTPSSGLKTRTAVTLGATVTNNNVVGASGCYAAAGLTYSWAMLSRPPGSLASVTDPTAAAPAFTPDLAGVYAFFVRVTDKLGNTGTASFSSPAVTNCSTPAVTLSQTPASPELQQSVSVSALVNDPVGSCGAPTTAPFTYAWTLATPAGSTAVLSNPRGASTSFVPDVTPGAYSYQVTVTDALGAQVTSSTGSTTPADCHIGSVTLPANGTSLTTFTTQQLSATVNFPGASCTVKPPLSYQWFFDSLPTGSAAAFNNATVSNPSFALDKPNGTWLVHVVVTDQLSGASFTSGQASFATGGCGANAITAFIGEDQPTNGAAVNHATPPPSAQAADATNTVGAGINVQLDGLKGLAALPNSACGGSAYSFKWLLYQLPPGSNASIKPDTAALPTVNIDKTGTYLFQLIVSDGLVTSAPTYFKLVGN